MNQLDRELLPKQNQNFDPVNSAKVANISSLSISRCLNTLHSVHKHSRTRGLEQARGRRDGNEPGSPLRLYVDAGN